MLNYITWDVERIAFTIGPFMIHWYTPLVLTVVLLAVYLWRRLFSTSKSDTLLFYGGALAAFAGLGSVMNILPYELLLTIYWYSLAFVTAFVFGQYFLIWVYREEKRKPEDAELVILYGIIGTVVGARLGHCLFYQPDYYLNNPIEILKVWEGGLASHGAAIGILIMMYFYVQGRAKESTRWRRTKKKYLWLLDRIVIVVASGGVLVRLGNLMNSEIIGQVTDVEWAFIFTKVDAEPRHPTQIYEAFCYLLTFLTLYYIYKRFKSKTPRGRIFGTFLVMIFTARFCLEFLKENQVGFEDGLMLNMGQLLSLPFIIVGFVILIKSYLNFNSNLK